MAEITSNAYIDYLLGESKDFDYEAEQKKYADRLQQFSPPPDRYNFFDLATDLSRGLTAQQQSNRPNSLAGGLALGFNQASQSMQQKKVESAKVRREIGLQAARMAMQSEEKANDYLNKALAELAKTDSDNEMKSYLYVSTEPLTVDGATYTAGDFIPLTTSQALKHRTKIEGGSSGGTKVTGSGAQAVYMSRPDAEKAVAALGLNRNLPIFEDTVQKITAKNEAQIGTPVIIAGRYTELTPLTKDGAVYNILLSGTEGQMPMYTIIQENRLKAIQKTKDAFNDKVSNVLPAVDRGLSLLMSGTETGLIKQAFLPIEQIAKTVFGTSNPGLMGAEDLQAISFFLGPKMRPVGSGSTSDMEFKAYQAAVLSLGKTPEANYISMYAFKKMTENAIILNRREEELLSDPTITDIKTVNQMLAETDTGIFEKLPENIDRNDETKVLEWFNSLPSGSVIDNSSGIFTDRKNPNKSAGPFIIVGWENRGR
tara:strand:+ start:39 stop:1490 length:1452 start_codon:yes stop_codon:yes gene_type:complete